MSTDPIVDLLRELPPDPPHPGDRFDQVRRRAVRRRRRRTSALVAGGLATVAVGVVLTQRVGAPATDRMVDPVTAPLAGGEAQVVELGAPVITVGTGTEEIDLGPRPAGANAVVFDLICRTAGTFTLPDGASMTCDVEPDPDVEPSVAHATFRVQPGETSAVLATDPSSSWSITTTWAEVDDGRGGGKGGGAVLGQPEGQVLVAPETDAGETALITGDVRVVDGCLGIDDSVALWPAGTRVVQRRPLTIDVPGLGEVAVGSSVRGGGGVVQPGRYRGDPALPSSCADASVVSFRPL